MKKTAIALTLLLSACAAGQDYQPTLLEQPANFAKYDADRIQCINESNAKYKKAQKESRESGRAALGAFGLLGGLIEETTREPDDALNMTPTQHTRACLIKKGYKLTL